MAISPLCQVSCFSVMGNMARPVNFMKMSRLPATFHSQSMNSLLRSNAGWNAQMVSEVFSKATVVILAKNIAVREGKFISRANIYSNDNKILPFL